jgi:cell division protein FtsQ
VRNYLTRGAVGGVVLAIGGLAAAVFGGREVCRRSTFFRVRQVEVVGAAHLGVDTVLAALALEPTASICDGLGAAEERVATVPGVAEVQVGRRLPGAVRVRVVEERAVAFVPGAEGLAAVDVEGRTLAFDPALAPLDLPIAETADTSLLAVLDRVQRVDPALARQITEARLIRKVVVLDVGGGQVVFDRAATPPVIQAVSLVAADLDARGRAWRQLDARYEGQVVVRLREGE